MENVLEYLEQAADEYPEKVALSDGEQSITYREYLHLAKKTGRMLLKRGVKAGDYVGVMAEKSLYTPVMFMGVLCAGCAYVPLDSDLPDEKMERIIDRAGINIIVRAADVMELACCFEDEYGIIKLADEDMPMCVMFTSGSTGIPKGVVKTHGAMIDFVESFSATFPMEKDEVIGNQTPFFFDASAKDIYLSIKYSATLQIIPKSLFMTPVKLVEYLNEYKVSTIFWVPSALYIIGKTGTLQEVKPKFLKNVFFVGEAMLVECINIWRYALPNVRYVNLYGSSEMAGVCCYYEIELREQFDEKKGVPIGKAFDNCEVILDDDEILVSSKTLFKEYLNDAEKTDAVLVNMDYGSGYKTYLRTGDHAYYNDNNDLVFIGRKDFQIKHKGYRIELGEIEAVANELPFVDRSACVYDKKHGEIVIWCECKDLRDISSEQRCQRGKEIRAHFLSKLPRYMMPRGYMIDRMPLNANGKIDRMELLDRLKYIAHA
ncbi:MAG: amino acid adenylation domain-containing protein [Lachnospira sp.]|nr:amino acid adenylation domain-containing protein [Lachnospira sp.]